MLLPFAARFRQLRLLCQETEVQHLVTGIDNSAEQQNVLLEAEQRKLRQKVIQEIIQTETDYLRSLQLCLKTFCGNDATKVCELHVLIMPCKLISRI